MWSCRFDIHPVSCHDMGDDGLVWDCNISSGVWGGAGNNNILEAIK
jgi:hypothetical protein